MLKQKNAFLKSFLARNKVPLTAAIASGLYPVIFYYTNNFSLINSWKHLGFFICLFLLVPVVTFFVAHRLFDIPSLQKWRKYVLPFLNVFTFLMFIQLCLYAKLQWLFTLIVIVTALLFSVLLYRHLKKIIILQFILVMVSLFWLYPTIKTQLSYSTEWMKQPDDIEQVIFKKRPNIYYIQPDGYVNFSEIDKGYYNLDNAVFKTYLEEHNFKLYPNIRSNYTSTLVSNSATFSMKHHYYNYGFNFSEIANAREVIISKNAVLDIFKRNNYKTHYVAEISYLLNNFPEMGYDECNLNYNDISFISSGSMREEDVTKPIEKYLKEDPEIAKFFFIEIFKPGHVSSKDDETLGAEKEFELYISNLKIANEKLTKTIDLIVEHDPDGLILIMADHGGYVGYDNMLDIRTRTSDRDLLYSAFSTQLSIKWPNGEAPEFDTRFKSGVNVFRILFSYLSEDLKYLNHLQDDGSYSIIDANAPKGIYKVIDANGNVVFKKH
jgi:hypothetical protein